MTKVRIRLHVAEVEYMRDALDFFNTFGFVTHPAAIEQNYSGPWGYHLYLSVADAGLFFGQPALLKPLSKLSRLRILRSAVEQLQNFAEQNMGSYNGARDSLWRIFEAQK